MSGEMLFGTKMLFRYRFNENGLHLLIVVATRREKKVGGGCLADAEPNSWVPPRGKGCDEAS